MTVIIWLEARLQPNIGFTLRCVLAVFTRSAITKVPKVNRLDEIWSTLSTLSGLALADFGLDPRSGDSWRAKRNFLSGKQRTISSILRRSNFTKFKHNTSIGVAMKSFET